jgi:hypothetical protein
MTFYDNINDFFENDEAIKNIINTGACINKLHSKIIKDYMDKMKGTDEYFEDKVLASFNEYAATTAVASKSRDYDEICNNIIFIYYKSIVELNDYYSDIYRKQRYLL